MSLFRASGGGSTEESFSLVQTGLPFTAKENGLYAFIVAYGRNADYFPDGFWMDDGFETDGKYIFAPYTWTGLGGDSNGQVMMAAVHLNEGQTVTNTWSTWPTTRCKVFKVGG